MRESNSKLLSPKQAAKILMVSPITVRQWAQKGKLKALTTAGGHRRFLLKDIEDFIQQHRPQPQDTDTLKILIIDDDEHILKLLTHVFDKVTTKKSIVQTATNGFEGGLKVNSFKPDILLLDLKMQGMDGFEVCKQVKQNHDTALIRIITMTGNASQSNIEKILALGAEACISKPIDIQSLLNYLGLAE